ncbi:MAG TPA: hypothetical protein VFJ71_14450 [Candidatus Limnocylindrales bacterium]|nr:hypothetical protein [Candidatus Limnocylindrales bacterium]
MIELMLEAERALAVGLLDKAEGHYKTVVANDPRNAIAIVGLARVALERDDQLATYLLARKALAIDPENPAASHLAHRMAEQLAMRGEDLPATPAPGSNAAAPEPGRSPAAAPEAPAIASPAPAPVEPRPRRPGLLDRLRRRDR